MIYVDELLSVTMQMKAIEHYFPESICGSINAVEGSSHFCVVAIKSSSMLLSSTLLSGW